MTIYETTDSGCTGSGRTVRTTEIDERSGRVTSSMTRWRQSSDDRTDGVAVLDWYLPEVRT